ncbi:MAG: acyl-CoA thioesterase [Gammaproteobacteria bacterium]|nr:acyl-CoA thioesterase [Gammaproteobacteria bacterium]NNC97227.1 acyl-CoA thioesterase [Gammaproteobacteria bacterium]NNM13386.1 acyl-CoA thioesterase [Gammaproteobacteria bacterium]
MKNIPKKQDYRYFVDVTTRWMDNDIYGHVNNATYYSYFDTAANKYLIDKCELDIQNSDTVGFVVASSCEYHAPIAYPDKLAVGVRVGKLGNSSVTYAIGIFKQNSDQAVAHGNFTHVFVDRASGQSTPIPENIRNALIAILEK